MSRDAPIRIVSWGGLGDALLTTPSFRALKRQRPSRRIVVYCATREHFELYRHNPHIDRLHPPGPRAAFERALLMRLRRGSLYEPAYGSLMPSLFYTRSVVDIIAEMLDVTLDVTLDDRRLEIFLQPDEERTARRLVASYANPIAIHVTSRCSPNQQWPLDRWETLVHRNPVYTFLQLGLRNEPLVPGAVDLRGALSLRHAIAVLKQVRAFVGVVSVFAHATNAVGTPGVVFYGPSSVAQWGHPANRNLDARVPCAPCVDLLGSAPCPYRSRCMTAISVRDVEEAIEAQLH